MPNNFKNGNKSILANFSFTPFKDGETQLFIVIGDHRIPVIKFSWDAGCGATGLRQSLEQFDFRTTKRTLVVDGICTVEVFVNNMGSGMFTYTSHRTSLRFTRTFHNCVNGFYVDGKNIAS